MVAANNTNTVDKKPEASIAKIENKAPDNKTAPIPVNNQPVPNEKKDVVTTNATTVEKKQEPNVAKTDVKLPDNKPVASPVINQATKNEQKDIPPTNTNAVVKTENKPAENKTVPATNTTIAAKTDSKQPDSKLVSVPVSYQPAQNVKKDVATTNATTADKKPETNIAKTDNKTTTAANQPTQNVKKDIAEKKSDAGFEFQEVKRDRKLKPAASLVDGRVSVPSETIYFKSDSLSIALYDNGEVDGDTVSVIINDEMFIQKQGLKSSAFRKTFYIPQTESDSLLVVLFAENLGKYPPNTGLF